MPNNLTKVLWTVILPIVLRLLKFMVCFCLSRDVCVHALHWKPWYWLLKTRNARLRNLCWTAPPVVSGGNYGIKAHQVCLHFQRFCLSVTCSNVMWWRHKLANWLVRNISIHFGCLYVKYRAQASSQSERTKSGNCRNHSVWLGTKLR